MPHQAPSHSLTVEHPFDLCVHLHGELSRSRVASPSHRIGVAVTQGEDEQLLTVLAEACAPFGDGRFHVCELTLVPGDGRLCLEGRVPDQAALATVLAHLRQSVPDAHWDAEGVRVLRRPAAARSPM